MELSSSSDGHLRKVTYVVASSFPIIGVYLNSNWPPLFKDFLFGLWWDLFPVDS